MFYNEEGRNLIPVKKSELLAAVKHNRQEHQKTYEEAVVGYRAEVIHTLESMLADAKAGKAVRQTLGLIVPTSHVKDYDRTIKALEMTTLDEISLSDGQFAQWVMDDWEWKAGFVGATASYLGAKR